MLTIVYAITSLFPTNKAFGVTLTQTQLAVEKLSNACEIWAPGKKESSSKNFTPFQFGDKYYKVFGTGQKSSLRSIRFLTYAIHTIFVALTIGRRLRSRAFDLIVIRETPLFVLVRIISPSTKILLELHHIPNKLQLQAVKLCLRFGNAELATISPYLVKKLKGRFHTSQIHLLPMASPNHFKEFASNYPKFKNSILYYGKLKSSGYDNGIIRFLSDLDSMPDIPIDTLVGIIGVSEEEQNSIEEEVTPINFELIFREHVPHDELPRIIREYQIGIIPYPNLPYHNERFPIKAVELASMGIPILCSSLPGLLEILPEEPFEWYSVDQRESLFEALRTLFSEAPMQLEIRRANLMSWSDPFTYDARARKLINIARQGSPYEED
jgi:glycosyltransferase involved in cell wall biosynthesis